MATTRNITTRKAKQPESEHVRTRLAFYKRLRELGCMFCPACFAYRWPEHQHSGSITVELPKAA